MFKAGDIPAHPKRLNLSGPILTKWIIEIARAGAKLNRTRANDIVKEILPLIPKEELAKYVKEMSFNEGYNLNF